VRLLRITIGLDSGERAGTCQQLGGWEDLCEEREAMARIKHIALSTEDPAKTAEFYKKVFGLQGLRDGYIYVGQSV
jgi:catechol-2,3-dioxygenase